MTQLIVGFFNTVSYFIEAYFPSVSFGSGVISKVVDAFSYFVKMIADINWLVPVNDVLLIFSLIVGYKLTMFIIFVINWIIKRIGDVIP